ncbi:MAG: hypothetical protein HY075_13280, partial [Deltaproteobacteria bacterium]|nr:hypothetical protein [Deltaproteobacteria bacterium]
MAVLYSATLFVSAFLLFAIQPMAGKALLPWLGGAPDVWNACMFFFQGVLLLGYLYAHALSRFASRRAQPFLHLAVLATATTVVLLVRPHAPDDAAQISTRPVFWILKSLAAWVGIPYFTLAATSPLLQKWFSSSRHRRAADPYFLYSASNWGSLAALLSYPLAVEPWLGLSSQRNVWAAGYVVLAFLLAAIAVSLARSRERFEARPRAARPARPARIAAWIGLAFLPSSLLLGATTYLSTDIAPIPLLWVVPLAIYLLTFIYAIEVSPRLLGKLRHACALLALMIVLTILKPSAYPVWLVVALHLALLGTAALLCHATLMRRRPHVGDLTLFYLCISIGGVLGGLFNSVLAPRLFTSLAEYPIAILLVCAMRSAVPERGEKKPRWKPDLGFAALVGALGVGLGYATALVPGLPT